jgi:hypothetical protein
MRFDFFMRGVSLAEDIFLELSGLLLIDLNDNADGVSYLFMEML